MLLLPRNLQPFWPAVKGEIFRNLAIAPGPRGGHTPRVEPFYDTHAHLTFPDFADDIPGLIDRAEEAGITRIITIGTDLESSQRAVAMAEAHAPVYAVVGWHPNDLEPAPDDVRPELRKLCGHPKVVAIGETGIDYFRLPKDEAAAETLKVRQEKYFRQQLELAIEQNLNVVVHQRAALEATLKIFEEYADQVRGQFHCFVDDAPAMRRVVELGSVVSFTGIITFKNAEEVREAAAAVPMEAVMVETDSPFLAPMPHRGKRCEPAYTRHTAEKVAEVKGVSLAELSAATCATAHAFFPKLG
jgi:TatD DNase family protein